MIVVTTMSTVFEPCEKTIRKGWAGVLLILSLALCSQSLAVSTVTILEGSTGVQCWGGWPWSSVRAYGLRIPPLTR